MERIWLISIRTQGIEDRYGPMPPELYDAANGCTECPGDYTLGYRNRVAAWQAAEAAGVEVQDGFLVPGLTLEDIKRAESLQAVGLDIGWAVFWPLEDEGGLRHHLGCRTNRWSCDLCGSLDGEFKAHFALGSSGLICRDCRDGQGFIRLPNTVWGGTFWYRPDGQTVRYRSLVTGQVLEFAPPYPEFSMIERRVSDFMAEQWAAAGEDPRVGLG